MLLTNLESNYSLLRIKEILGFKLSNMTGPIKFDIQLSDEQKDAKRIILENDITLVLGGAGSGKTLVAVQTAMDLFFKKECEKIYFARPAVTADENLGFLPGNLKDKLEEFILPVLENLCTVYGSTKSKQDKITKHLEEKDWEILSIGHLRGRTFTNSIIVVDECQNVTIRQMALILTRLGHGSKMILTGDLAQHDLKHYTESGMRRLLSVIPRINGMAEVTLKDNFRSGVVKEIIEIWDTL